MANVHDVAAMILHKQGQMTAMKLQKLVYYCQAWHLVWDEEPLFPERIEAWANGPVVRELYDKHRGRFEVGKTWAHGKRGNLTVSEKETIEVVLSKYGPKTGAWLSEMTHREEPWRNARRGLRPGQRGSTLISRASMAKYYESLL